MIGPRLVGVAGLVLAAIVLPAGPAHATVTHTHSNVTDVLTVTSDAASDAIVVTCAGANVAVNGVALAGPTVPCVEVDTLNVNGGGGNDIIDTTNFIRDVVNLDGGDGDDSLTGAEPVNPLPTTLNATGGPGNDVLRFASGDSIAGGDGDDTFPYLNSLHPSTLVLQGQGGTDTYLADLSGVGSLPFDIVALGGGLAISFGGPTTFAPWSGIEVLDLKLTDGSEIVRLAAFPGRGRIESRGGNDTLIGGDGADAFLGGSGNDTLEGGGGADSLDGGEGDDVVRSRDTFADSVACGDGSDVALVDAADSTSACETLDRGSSTDGTKPEPTFSGAKVAGSKLKLTATCPATELRCVGQATLSVKGKRGAANRNVKVGRVLIVADGGRKDQITVALTTAQRAALKGLSKAKLTIAYDVMDAGGNVGKGKKTIKLKT
jgi:Ca2+-binding RTX toxin-like protein